jgi:hypothetical protein
MQIVKKLNQNEDGSWEASWSLSNEQMQFLLTYAINSLVAEGVVQIDVKSQENEKQMQLDFLKEVPTDLLYKA